jgi:hypothetical protein
MNEEKLALETLKALGAKDTSSPSQIKYLNIKQVILEKIY